MPGAANTLVDPVFLATQTWNETLQVSEWVSDPTWICTWTAPQTINTIKFYDGGGYTEGFTPHEWYWGNTGTVEFSDGSSIAWSGLPNNGTKVVTFAAKTVSWFKITSTDYNTDPNFYGQHKVLVEVEAFLTE